ncbi:hypothetical protein BDV41DRAFT_558148, partial [Aspergillus transmontanensis]
MKRHCCRYGFVSESIQYEVVGDLVPYLCVHVCLAMQLSWILPDISKLLKSPKLCSNAVEKFVYKIMPSLGYLIWTWSIVLVVSGLYTSTVPEAQLYAWNTVRRSDGSGSSSSSSFLGGAGLVFAH